MWLPYEAQGWCVHCPHFTCLDHIGTLLLLKCSVPCWYHLSNLVTGALDAWIDWCLAWAALVLQISSDNYEGILGIWHWPGPTSCESILYSHYNLLTSLTLLVTACFQFQAAFRYGSTSRLTPPVPSYRGISGWRTGWARSRWTWRRCAATTRTWPTSWTALHRWPSTSTPQRRASGWVVLVHRGLLTVLLRDERVGELCRYTGPSNSTPQRRSSGWVVLLHRGRLRILLIEKRVGALCQQRGCILRMKDKAMGSTAYVKIWWRRNFLSTMCQAEHFWAAFHSISSAELTSALIRKHDNLPIQYTHISQMKSWITELSS